jgi:putative peptidoglycan lipid II flippase
VVNITLAAILVSRFKGAGIAFALTVASAVNTAVLLIFLHKNPSIALGQTLKSAIAYALKLILFSAIALIPVLFLSPVLSEFFAGRGRLISLGAPLLINALIFAATGIFLLIITRDKQFLGMVKLFSSRGDRD